MGAEGSHGAAAPGIKIEGEHIISSVRRFGDARGQLLDFDACLWQLRVLVVFQQLTVSSWKLRLQHRH